MGLPPKVLEVRRAAVRAGLVIRVEPFIHLTDVRPDDFLNFRRRHRVRRVPGDLDGGRPRAFLNLCRRDATGNFDASAVRFLSALAPISCSSNPGMNEFEPITTAMSSPAPPSNGAPSIVPVNEIVTRSPL